MAVYEGSTGIKALRDKINLKSKMLVGESLEKINTHMVDESIIGADYYNSIKGQVENDNGQYKNSWCVGIGSPNNTTRTGDTTGASAVADGMVKAKLYNLEPESYITNSADYAQLVEEGWNDNPEYGWKAKSGYHIVSNNVGASEALLYAVALKVSQM